MFAKIYQPSPSAMSSGRGNTHKWVLELANSIPYRVSKPKVRKRISRSYAENFAFDRKLPWTH